MNTEDYLVAKLKGELLTYVLFPTRVKEEWLPDVTGSLIMFPEQFAKYEKRLETPEEYNRRTAPRWTKKKLRSEWRKIFNHNFPLLALTTLSQRTLLEELKKDSNWSVNEIEKYGFEVENKGTNKIKGIRR